ncbi:MAG: MFS transporter [Holophaga sp.]|nr:MFS transporter [Holophaga sp.]
MLTEPATSPAGSQQEPEGIRTPRKAAIAAWIGSALEYYDFFVYGTAAALIFGKLFFPSKDPAVGTIAALATFGVGYVARPIGSFFLGHLGDKYGRKKVLILTLVMMGISTFLVGCLPTYQEVGILAPILLVLCRLLQGISAAGEQAGANSMSLEHAPANRRAFFTSWTLSGTQGGLILATLVFLPIGTMPEAQLLAWGWRIPFFFSVVVVAAGIWIRRTLEETPAFKASQKAAKNAPVKVKLPVVVLFRENPGGVVKIIFACFYSVVSTVFAVYTLSYGVNQMHIAKSTMLTVVVLANVIALGAIPAWAMIADRVGRKPIFIFGTLGCAVLIWPYLWSIRSMNVPLIFVLGLLLSGIVYSANNGIWPAMFNEQFDTRYRLSGTAIGTQIGFALGGFAPAIAASLMKSGGWTAVALFTSGTAVISAIAAMTFRETFNVAMVDLGKK